VKIKKSAGVAGQYSLTAETEHGPVAFVGSNYGGPVVMITDSGVQTFVTDPGRFGEFGEAWVRRFVGEAS
jgi:hypothetical protein